MERILSVENVLDALREVAKVTPISVTPTHMQIGDNPRWLPVAFTAREMRDWRRKQNDRT